MLYSEVVEHGYFISQLYYCVSTAVLYFVDSTC